MTDVTAPASGLAPTPGKHKLGAPTGSMAATLYVVFSSFL